jgi:hypothetical protein
MGSVRVSGNKSVSANIINLLIFVLYKQIVISDKLGTERSNNTEIISL